jgi:hypothetical protein
MAALSAAELLAHDALGFMGQAGYAEEADVVLSLSRTTWGDDKLLRAALAGRRRGPKPCHGWRKRTRLMAAAHFGRLARVSLLLANGAAVAQRDKFGGSAMSAAVLGGHSSIVAALRMAGAAPFVSIGQPPVLEGHDGAVWNLAALPDGRLVSSGVDKTVRIWNLSTRVCEAELEGYEGSVECLAVLPDGMLVSGGEGDGVRMWSTALEWTANKVGDSGHRGIVFALATVRTGLAAGYDDGRIRLWS